MSEARKLITLYGHDRSGKVLVEAVGKRSGAAVIGDQPPISIALALNQAGVAVAGRVGNGAFTLGGEILNADVLTFRLPLTDLP